MGLLETTIAPERFDSHIAPIISTAFRKSEIPQQNVLPTGVHGIYYAFLLGVRAQGRPSLPLMARYL
jgi:hypothetical protein